jgi:hypothetical protein
MYNTGTKLPLFEHISRAGTTVHSIDYHRHLVSYMVLLYAGIAIVLCYGN